MGLTHNTAYKTKVDDITDSELSSCNIEDGALARTTTGLYMGHAGSNVKIYPQVGSTEDVTVNNFTVTGGVNYNVRTIDSATTLDGDDHVIFVNDSSQVNITLPLAATYEGKEYIIRTRHNSEKAVVSRSGSDKIDDGGLENSIDINADKSRTLISDGTSTWYVVTSTGA